MVKTSDNKDRDIKLFEFLSSEIGNERQRYKKYIEDEKGNFVSNDVLVKIERRASVFEGAMDDFKQRLKDFKKREKELEKQSSHNREMFIQCEEVVKEKNEKLKKWEQR